MRIWIFSAFFFFSDLFLKTPNAIDKYLFKLRIFNKTFMFVLIVGDGE